MDAQWLVQKAYRDSLMVDTRDALDAAEVALRHVERSNALSAGMEQPSYDEAHQLIASSYERLARARQIFEVVV